MRKDNIRCDEKFSIRDHICKNKQLKLMVFIDKQEGGSGRRG